MGIEFSRYAKQIRFTEVGSAGQLRLNRSKVAIVGVGATGSFIACLLARAGIGVLRVVDRDYVELDNLQRQILFDESDVASCSPKAEAAKNHLHAINSEISVESVVADVTSKNVEELVSGFDLILDGTDNFLTRFLLNDVCRKNNISWIYTGVIGGHGISLAMVPPGPCFRCFLPQPPASGQLDTCDTAGVIGATVGALASLTVATSIKLMTGKAVPSEVMMMDVWDPSLSRVTLTQNPACPCCRLSSYDFLGGKYEPETVSLCGRNAVHISNTYPSGFDLEVCAKRIAQAFPIALITKHTLKFALPGDIEVVVFKDGRAIIKGTQELSVAKSIYAKYVGS